MDWQRFKFKQGKVYVWCDDQARPVVRKGRVWMRYQLADAHLYTPAFAHLLALDGKPVEPCPDPAAAPPPELAVERATTGKPTDPDLPDKQVPVSSGNGIVPVKASRTRQILFPVLGFPPPPRPADERPVTIYADGACTGNPGPAGCGVVLLYGAKQREISRYLGEGTNNIAELTAIAVAVEALRNKQLPVDLFTDSAYALGVLSGHYKVKANQELVRRVQHLLSTLTDFRFIKTPGHAGVPGNERADQLARQAIETRGDSDQYESTPAR